MSNFAPNKRRNKPDPLRERKKSSQSSRISSDSASGEALPSESQKPLYTHETVLAWVTAILLGEVTPPIQKPPVVIEPIKRGRK